MSCTKHFLNLQWEHHAWRRRVVATEQVSIPMTEMWGRRSTEENVRCHVDYVCDTCGATRDGEDCLCDLAKGDRCPARLEYLASRNAGGGGRTRPPSPSRDAPVLIAEQPNRPRTETCP